jgi:hypothetical protein
MAILIVMHDLANRSAACHHVVDRTLELDRKAGVACFDASGSGRQWQRKMKNKV